MSPSELGIAVRSSLIAGRGLFATQPIEKDKVIICMEKSIVRTQEDAENAGFPSDSVVFVEYKPLVTF